MISTLTFGNFSQGVFWGYWGSPADQFCFRCTDTSKSKHRCSVVPVYCGLTVKAGEMLVCVSETKELCWMCPGSVQSLEQ